MTLSHVDLNEAAKCIDHIAGLFIAPSHTRTKYQNGDEIWPNLQSFMNQFMKIGGIETHDWCSAVGKVAF